jgi:hypothetical protein
MSFLFDEFEGTYMLDLFFFDDRSNVNSFGVEEKLIIVAWDV